MGSLGCWKCDVVLGLLLVVQVCCGDPAVIKLATLTKVDLSQWSSSSCTAVSRLFKAKERVTEKLSNALNRRKRKENLTEAQIKTIRIFQGELNVTERAVLDALNGLRKLLEEDYKSVVSMKEAINLRLESLKALTLQQEDQYNAIVDAEKAFLTANKHADSIDKQSNGTLIEKLIGGVLDDISFAADQLEDQLEEKTFEKGRNAKGASIEAVVRLNNGEESLEEGNKNHSSLSEPNKENDMSILVDSQNNQFVLSKAKDATIPHEDLHFIKDIIVIMLLSFVGACACAVVRLPTMFGFVVSGMLVGPSGLNIIKVQTRLLSSSHSQKD